MSNVAAETLALVVVNVVLVVVTIVYVILVYKQLKQSYRAALLQRRYQLESDITQLRIMDAQLADNKAAARNKLTVREEQCKITIDEIVKELKKG